MRGMKKTVRKSSPAIVPERSLRVLFVASECAPYAKCGGLGDVVASLPKALRKLGVDARVALPLYRTVSKEKYGLEEDPPCLANCGGGEVNGCGIWRGTADGGVPVWFVEHNRFFDRGGVYDENGVEFGDNAFRFGLLCMAAAQVCRDRGWMPDVVHVHDWPTAVFPALLDSWRKAKTPLGWAASVLTIHNQSYQGYSHASALGYLGLGQEYYTPDGLEAWGKINLLKGGIAYADAITTVSPTYAEEILREPGGNGLSEYLRRRKRDFGGILNGADYDVWNPETDRLIPANYRANSLIGKGQCKLELQAQAGLAQDAAVPLFGIVTRLAQQKGTGLMREALPRALDGTNAQLAMLGSGDGDDENFFRWLARRYPGRVSAEIGYSEELSHRIQAGADFFLMPSLFEPCGLTQMYSLRYGSLPVVHATGGLEDTVEQYEPGAEVGTGFKFRTPTAEGFFGAMRLAAETWSMRPSDVTRMRERAMQVRFDWEESARKYLDVYRRVALKRAGGG